MANYNHINIDQMKQQQMLTNMRAQQMASDKQKLDFEGRKGSKTQFLGTFLAIAGAIIVLIILSFLG